MIDENALLRELEDATGEVSPGRRQARAEIVRAVSGTRADSFGPMFSDRVLVRIREARRRREESLYFNLRWMGRRLVLAGLAAALILGGYNMTREAGFSTNVVESLLGLPSPGLEATVLLAEG